ncbi:dihydrolipoyl dehydrogenase [Notoacmeibacter sp. MSK16QG-6]|uniref:dihydrolipoyl dehydrogenase n=1 Tax=Notoacmeibacter sp. MSK16QG-6 TaxID=2957982 RepID=UPI00209F4792|nr:dihydrolipoyl dehydrogenase [Notoacmeibacter sp. MSK16QG-6]MCP1199194.1 dihydrolipoyl dehydrogenase [Notoacmeibacter sp. MSK16QG-6]
MAYDVIVIGSGPGGYVCAIKAAQLGLKTAVVEKRATLGGTCLNIGCIPSKALLHASEEFHKAGHEFEQLGIKVGTPELDLPAMMAHKDKTVKSNVDGVEFLFKKNKIDRFRGTGRIAGQGQVVVAKDDGSEETVEGKNIVIATGSDVAGIPGVEVDIDEEVIVSSTGGIALDNVPQRMIVVGGGVIGLELGSVWKRLGADVTVIEFLPKILGGMDGEISKQFQRLLKKQGVDVRLSSKVTAVEKGENSASVTFEPVDGGDAETMEADIVLISTGRRPYTDSLGLDDAGIETDRGRVVIDDHFATNVNGIYAIGDVVRGPMLAHKAEDEGIAVAEILAGQAGHVNYDVIPSVVYTAPEVASVGKTEEELKEAGVEYSVGKFSFSANGRARAMLTTDGFVKVLADKKTDRVLGVHILGHNAGEMIHEAAVLMEFSGSSEDLARTCHAHPTMSEAVREAALACFAKPIHS